MFSAKQEAERSPAAAASAPCRISSVTRLRATRPPRHSERPWGPRRHRTQNVESVGFKNPDRKVRERTGARGAIPSLWRVWNPRNPAPHPEGSRQVAAPRPGGRLATRLGLVRCLTSVPEAQAASTPTPARSSHPYPSPRNPGAAESSAGCSRDRQQQLTRKARA